MHGLNTYDYGARQYYAALPIWDRMDPLCEKYYGVSPYVYCLNDPIKHIDPDGKKVVLFGTKLPADVNSEHPWLHIIAGSATHTFVAVRDDKTNKLNGYISNYIKSVCTMFLLDYLIVSIGIIVLNIIFRLNKKDI